MDKQYSIREVSAKFNLPASTLRYYEEVGILTDIPRNSSGKRIYLEKHINRLKTICCFKNTGMSISQLQEFFQYLSVNNPCANGLKAIIPLFNLCAISFKPLFSIVLSKME
jgi:DNA-binding transcriptional MerR regulator